MKISKNEKNILDDILLNLKDSNFFENHTVFSSTDEDVFGEEVEDWEDHMYYWRSGASKFVILLDDIEDFDLVVKIPFMGRNEETWDDDKQCYENTNFYYFEGAADGKDGWDYCAVEYNLYKIAEAQGLSACFAAVDILKTDLKYPVYMQEKAVSFNDYYYDEESDHYSEDESKYTDEQLNSTKEKCKENKISNFNNLWLTDFIQYYGVDIFIKFSQFIRENHINDLHDSNIGYIGNRPVLIDYSGWDY